MATNFNSNARIVQPDETQMNGANIQPDIVARPIVSSLDTWDQLTHIDYAFASQSTGRRAGWNIPSIGVTAETVNTVRSSAATRFVSPTIVSPSGKAMNPVTALGNFRVVPNMAQSLFVDSEVQVTFTVLISTATQASPAFAVFRDGQKISQEYRQLTGGGNVQSLVSGTYVDTGAALRKYHVYDLRWRTVNNITVTAFENNRTFQASNLRAV